MSPANFIYRHGGLKGAGPVTLKKKEARADEDKSQRIRIDEFGNIEGEMDRILRTLQLNAPMR